MSPDGLFLVRSDGKAPRRQRLLLAQQRQTVKRSLAKHKTEWQAVLAEACQARADQESLRRAQLEAEQEAAATRAAASPLSALTWAVKTAPKASPLEMEAPVVRAGAPPRFEFMTREVEKWEVDQIGTMLDSLTKEFGRRAIVDAGIAVENGDGSLTLNGGTAEVPTMVCPLRKEKGSEPFDLVTGSGCFSGRLPVCAAMEDGQILASMEPTCGGMLAVFSPGDLAVLRLMSLPAMPAIRLPTLGGRDLDEFCRAFEIRYDDGRPYDQPQETAKPSWASKTLNDQDDANEGHGAEDQVLPDQRELILVGWSPARLSLDPPEELDKLVSHLREIDRHLHVALGDVYLWRPSPEEIESIDFCVRHGRREDVQEALVRSIEESAGQLTCPPKPRSVPENFSAAATQLQESLRGTAADPRKESELWAQYLEKIELELVRPLTEQAAAASDPTEKSLLVAMAGISQLAHPLAVSLVAKMTKSVHETGLTTVASIPETELRQLLSMSDRMVALAKECGPCKRNQTKW